MFQLHRAHLNAVAMMNVDVDIEDAFVVLQQLQDANDNAPQFRKEYYHRSIAENAKLGTTIVSVVADDVDRNRSISYSLQVRAVKCWLLWWSCWVVASTVFLTTKNIFCQ